MAKPFGRTSKLIEQLNKLDEQEIDELLESGYFSAICEAYQTGTLPGIDEFRRRLELDQCLRLRDKAVDLPARSEKFISADYFQTRDGLYVWDGFKNLILPATGDIKETSTMKVASFDLLRDATDKQIKAELPEGHVFQDVNVFCSHLAGLIDRQTGEDEVGKKIALAGPLLTTGYSNIFYVQVVDEVFEVDVYWYAGYRRWFVSAYHLGDAHPWHSWNCAFSAAAVA